MKTTKQIIKEEFIRMARGVIPLTLIACGVFMLFGYTDWGTFLSLVGGAAYALINFLMICISAQLVLSLPPEKAQSRMTRSYFGRYALTTALLVLAFYIPFLNPAAFVVPLLFPKIVLVLSSLSRKKGG